jgi:lambda family phage portal protein
MARDVSFAEWDRTHRAMPPARTSSGRPPARASLDGGSGGMFFPYDAAQWFSPEMGDWLPRIHSPDYEIDWNRDRVVARARDLYRNEGWARGSIGHLLDSTIGSEYRAVIKPDWRWLAWRYSSSFDAVWAREFRQAAEACWRTYANDPLGHWNDVERQLTVSQQLRLALGHKLVDGESLILGYWLEDRIGYNGAAYATAYQVLDPDRLANPYLLVDNKNLRGGVEIDDFGVPIAYNIRQAEPYDWYNAVESMTWERIEREDEDGFLRVIHDYDRDRAGQHRGLSIFAPVMGPLKMLARYYGVELQAATVASVLGLAITSPYDEEEVRQAMEATPVGADSVPPGWEFYNSYLGERRRRQGYDQGLMLGGVRVPVLGMGEKIEGQNAARPHSNFSPFTHEMLRRFAAVTGQSAEQVTQDYSEASWSSARAGIVEAEKMYVRRLKDFNANTATPMLANMLSEPYEQGLLPMPRGADPQWLEARVALTRCRWLGTARGWVDPVAERQGAVLGLDAGFSTLEEEAAQQGMDFEENIEQRAYEIDLFKKHNIPLPEWGGKDMSAQEVSQKPGPV